MLKYNFTLIIFILLLQQTFAANIATVISNKAIVYSDVELSTAIGYIKNGKKVYVGDVRRKRGTVVPVVLFGRVAYIKVSDISSDNKSLETKKARLYNHDLEEVEKDQGYDKLSLNNYLNLGINIFSPTSNSTNAMSVADEQETSSSSYSLFVEHRHPIKKYSFGFGIDTYEVSSENISYRTNALSGQYNWIPFRTRLFSLETFGGVTFSLDFRVTVKNIGVSKGQMYGGYAGTQVKFFPNSTFGVITGISYTKMTISGIKNISNDTNDDQTDVNQLSGAKVFVLASWKFI